jgi:hypothetical protein
MWHINRKSSNAASKPKNSRHKNSRSKTQNFTLNILALIRKALRLLLFFFNEVFSLDSISRWGALIDYFYSLILCLGLKW